MLHSKENYKTISHYSKLWKWTNLQNRSIKDPWSVHTCNCSGITCSLSKAFSLLSVPSLPLEGWIFLKVDYLNSLLCFSLFRTAQKCWMGKKSGSYYKNLLKVFFELYLHHNPPSCIVLLHTSLLVPCKFTASLFINSFIAG